MRSKVLFIATVFGVLVSSPDRAQAATIQVTLNLVGNREIEIPITVPPGEFDLQTSSWGTVTFGGVLVGYYVFSTEDKQHLGSLAPTVYPNPWYTIVIRINSSPSELLILEGSRKPLSEGGDPYGGVTVATGALAFLRGATFTSTATSAGVILTLTY